MLASYSNKVVGLIDSLGTFCVKFGCSSRVMGSLGSPASSHNPKICMHWIGNSKLSLSVCVSVNGCLSIYVALQ